MKEKTDSFDRGLVTEILRYKQREIDIPLPLYVFFKYKISIKDYNFQFLNFDSMKEKIDSIVATEDANTEEERETIVLNKQVNQDYT